MSDEWTVLNLQMPEQIEVDLDPAVEHDLSAGVAVQIDGRYYRIVCDEIESFVPDEHEGSLVVDIDIPNNLDPASISVRLSP